MINKQSWTQLQKWITVLKDFYEKKKAQISMQDQMNQNPMWQKNN